MRKKMSKEVTFTKVRISKIEVVKGLPVAKEMEPETLLGNIDQEKAQKIMDKKFGTGYLVFETEVSTNVYEMDVEKFIELATLKTDNDESDEDDNEDSEEE